MSSKLTVCEIDISAANRQGSSGAISHGGQEGGRAGGDRARTHSVTLSAQEVGIPVYVVACVLVWIIYAYTYICRQ